MTDNVQRTELLFSYGTLQDEGVQRSTLGRILKGDPDSLPGYTLSRQPIDDEAVVAASGKALHPIARQSARHDDRVEGTVFRVTPDELALCDRYETREYQRVRVTLTSNELAWAYVRAATSARPATFVLVHGAWAGGWAWRRVAERLTARGHRVHVPTLSGLGERSHLAAHPINLTTHIDDVVNEILWKDLNRVVLVGHSYAGFVITGVAERLADRLASIVYVDAFIPEDGACFADLGSWIDTSAPLVPAPPSAPGDYRSDADRAWVDAKATAQPVGTFTERLRVTDAYRHVPHKAFIQATNWDGPFDASYDAAARDPGWSAWQVASGHDIPIDEPEQLAALLDQCS